MSDLLKKIFNSIGTTPEDFIEKIEIPAIKVDKSKGLDLSIKIIPKKDLSKANLEWLTDIVSMTTLELTLSSPPKTKKESF